MDHVRTYIHSIGICVVPIKTGPARIMVQLWLALLDQYRASTHSLFYFANIAVFAHSLLGDGAAEYLRDPCRVRADSGKHATEQIHGIYR